MHAGVIFALVLWLDTPASVDPVSRAQSLVQSGDYRGALEVLAPVLKSDSKNAQAHLTAAAACIALKDVRCGEPQLKAAKGLAADNPAYDQLLCRLRLVEAEDAQKEGRDEKSAAFGEKAVEAAEKALARSPGQPQLLALRAMSLRAAGRTDEAIQAYAAWRMADPRNPDVYGATAAMLVELDRWSDTAALMASAPAGDESLRLAIDLAVLRNGLVRVPWKSTEPLFDSVRARNTDPGVEHTLELYHKVLAPTDRSMALQVLDYLDADPGDALGLGAALLARSAKDWATIDGVGDDVVLPILESGRDPHYPDDARSARIEGKVVLVARIRDDGSVGSVHVLSSTSDLFDEAAAACVRSRHYQPATRGGKPIELAYLIRIDFRLG